MKTFQWVDPVQGLEYRIYRLSNLKGALGPTNAIVHAADPLHFYFAPFLFVPTTIQQTYRFAFETPEMAFTILNRISIVSKLREREHKRRTTNALWIWKEYTWK